MKIAIVTPFRNYFGGVEVVNTLLEKVFNEAGHEVTYITADNYDFSNFCDKFFARIIGLPYLTSKRFKLSTESFDVVIANGEFSYAINHPRVINLFHGCYKGYRDYLCETWAFKSYLGLTRGIYLQKIGAKNNFVVSVSSFIKEILDADGVNVDQVIVNCIDTDKFRPLDVDRVNKCLFVGTNNYYAKGFDVLEKLSEENINIDCVTNEKPNSNLGWLRNVNNDEMPEIYNRYDILLFPSRFEGLGLVPLEAMACGLPIVMSDVGVGRHLKEIIPEFVVSSYDYSHYIEKIKCIQNNRLHFSRKARQYVEQYYTYDVFNKKWLNLIQEIGNA